MSGEAHVCIGYSNMKEELVASFRCPREMDNVDEAYCCGFSDLKYCCNEASSYFPYPHGYMWSLSVGAMVGLGVAAVLLLVFFVSVFVICCLYLYNKPQGLDSGLRLQPLTTSSSQKGKKKNKQGCLETTLHLPAAVQLPITNRITQEKLLASIVETEITTIKVS